MTLPNEEKSNSSGQDGPSSTGVALTERHSSDCRKAERWDLFNLRSTHVGQRSQHGWYREDPITEGGKRRQMVKMLTLILTPIIVLLCVSFYFVSDNITAKMESDKVRSTILFSVEVGKLVHVMQKERDLSVLYLSKIRPETKTFLTNRYMETDEQLANLPGWPADLDVYERRYFQSKRSFQNYLTRHRNELELLNQTLYDEILFYSGSIKVFVRWLYDAIKESEYGTIWKTLVAYQKVVVAKEDIGVERALGSAYFSLGGFVSQTIYEWYNEKLHVYRANIRSAVRYSALVKPIADARISSGGKNLTDMIESFRNTIQKRMLSKPSLRAATWYFDNMTSYIDLLFLVQSDLAKGIISTLDDSAADVATGVAVSSVIILIVVVMCPVLVKTVRSLTNDIQRYALTLVDKTCELNQERAQIDVLLYQMLPRQAADEWKQHRELAAHYYKELTVLFSDVVGFGYVTNTCTPDQIVSVLNMIYSIFDTHLEKFEVYNVEAIVDSYMIASGLPQRVGGNHADIMANMSLSLLSKFTESDFAQVPGCKLRLRIGINTASKIHISSSTHRLLAKSGGYVLQMRGPMDLKGKTRTVTYWLLDMADSRVSERKSNDRFTAPFSQRSDTEIDLAGIPMKKTPSKEGPHNLPKSETTSIKVKSSVPRNVPETSEQQQGAMPTIVVPPGESTHNASEAGISKPLDSSTRS